MRNLMVCGAALAGLMLASEAAQARPQYLKAFSDNYAGLAEAAGKVKCGVCHPEADKKVRNDYAKALGKAIGKANEKDADALKAALTKAEAEKSAGGPTFGEIIKGGKLPN